MQLPVGGQCELYCLPHGAALLEVGASCATVEQGSKAMPARHHLIGQSSGVPGFKPQHWRFEYKKTVRKPQLTAGVGRTVTIAGRPVRSVGCRQSSARRFLFDLLSSRTGHPTHNTKFNKVDFAYNDHGLLQFISDTRVSLIYTNLDQFCTFSSPDANLSGSAIDPTLVSRVTTASLRFSTTKSFHTSSRIRNGYDRPFLGRCAGWNISASNTV